MAAALTRLAVLLVLGQASPMFAGGRDEIVVQARRPFPTKFEEGEYGSDLRLLRSFYTAPEGPDESNHFIDMWVGQQTRFVSTLSGLTNNNTLFVNSHGKGFWTTQGLRYGYYPHERLVSTGADLPFFSAKDLATVVGSGNAKKIHNIVLAGCDPDGSFDARVLRRFFVNATNITHVLRGRLGYQPMFFRSFLSHSIEIKRLYETALPDKTGRLVYYRWDTPQPNAVELWPYMAELFYPRGEKPFRTQIAGRELLVPNEARRDLVAIAEAIPREFQ